MERVETDVTSCWERLRAEARYQVAACVPAFFRELPAADVHTIHALIRDGKQLRGSMVLAVSDALGGATAGAAPAAVAIECIQAASLIHDDFVDRDRTRRNRPAAWLVHGSRRAVLLADMIFATALHRAAELGREEVLTLARAIAKVAAGAYKEPVDLNEMQSVSDACTAARPLYERIIHLKTGALFEAAAELGAIRAGATLPLRKAAATFGARTGEAYQIADDLRDIVMQARAPLSPQHQATLALLRAYFGIPGAVSRPRSTVAAGRAAGNLAPAMEREIAKRIGLAQEALGSFPRTPSLAMLRCFPRLILQAATAGAQGELEGPVRDCERR